MKTKRNCLLALLFVTLWGCGGQEPQAETDTAAEPVASQVAQEIEPADNTAHVEQLYHRSCFACHSNGTAGAPRTGDQTSWEALIAAKGMDGLVASAIEGIGGMPPRGLCAQCTETDFALLIEFMAQGR